MNFRSAWWGAGLVLAGCGGAFTFDHGSDAGAAGGGEAGSLRDASSSGASGDASSGGSAGRGGSDASGGGGSSGGSAGHGGAVIGGGAGVLGAGAAGLGTGGVGMGGARDGGFSGRPDAAPAVDAARADAAADVGPPVPADAGPEAAAVDISACTGPGQCTAVLRTCCATCTTPEASSYVGVNEAYAGPYRTSICGRGVCPAIACPVATGDGSNPNIGAQCVMGRCEVFDVRRVPQFSGCVMDSDCTMRTGVGCCECTAAPWVAVSSSGRRALATAMCSPAARCLACVPTPPAGQQSLCQNGVCLLSP